jgi:arylsulfate sulfotransferase
MKKIMIFIGVILIIGIPAYYFYNNKNTKSNQPKPEGPLKYEYTINACDSDEKGYIISSPSEEPPIPGQLLITDMCGRVVFEKKLTGSPLDFRQWRIGNKVLYSYMVREAAEKYQIFHGVILDSAMNELKQVHLISHDDIVTKKNIDLDGHDLVVLADNHFITMSGYPKKVKNIPDSLHPYSDVTVVSCILQESIDGKIVWQWDATKYPEFYATSVERNNFSDKKAVLDYMHANCITLDPKDGNIIVSFWCLNQIIKVERGTGNILWRLGGKNSDFPIAAHQRFLGQHSIVFEDSNQTLMLLDNGNDKRPYSRVLEYRLDEKNKKILAFKAYKIPHKFVGTQGSVAKDGNRYLVGGGRTRYTLLVDPENDKYIFEQRANIRSYRVYKVDSLYGLEKTKGRK